jgi:hypothetical protein
MHVPEKTDVSSLHGRMLSRSLAFFEPPAGLFFAGHITYADHRSIRMAL